MLYRNLESKSRGTVVSVNGVANSLFLLFMYKVGSMLYDNVSKSMPFWLSLGAVVLSGVYTFIFGLLGKISWKNNEKTGNQFFPIVNNNFRKNYLYLFVV